MGKAKKPLVVGAAAHQQVKADIKVVVQTPQPAKSAADAGDAWAVVGADVEIQQDYHDMKDAGEENGWSNAGYLVLNKGEVVRILYIGSTQTEDAEWLYGEVVKSQLAAQVGRRGWFPRAIAEPPPKPPEPLLTSYRKDTTSRAAAPPAPPARPVAVATDAGYQRAAASRPAPQRAAPAAVSFGGRSAAAAPKAPSGGRGRGNAFNALASEDAFPSLCPAPDWWGREDEEEEVAPPPPPRPVPEPPSRPQDVEGTIARHRALAAAAAAKVQPKAKTKAPKGKGAAQEASCPICTEKYSAQRRRAVADCCGGELCGTCSEKSLRSKRCYFCREEASAFPSLASLAKST